MKYSTTTRWMILAALVVTPACGGGSGGEGAPAPPAPSVSGLTRSGALAGIAMQSGDVTLRTGLGPAGWRFASTVTFDPTSGRLFTVAAASPTHAAVLLRVDPSAGNRGLASAPVAVAELDHVPTSLAWKSDEGVLFGVAPIGAQPWQPGRLLRIDPSTGATEVVGECARVRSLAYDPATSSLYGIQGEGFVRIDPGTGASLMLFSESAILPGAHGLALDPVTGIFRTAVHDPSTPPALATIDLFGAVDIDASTPEPLLDLAVDPASGTILGLSTGLGVARLVPGSSAYGIEQRGALGCDLFDMAYDPEDRGYFGLTSSNHIVKLWASGGVRTIGYVEDEMFSIVYDSDRRELWGLRESDQALVPIDRSNAATGMPRPAGVSGASKMAYDATNRAFRAFSHLNGVTIEFDPTTGQAGLTSNGQGLGPMAGLTWDPVTERLVGAWDTGPGASGAVRVSSWDPFVSGDAVPGAILTFEPRTFARHGTLGVYHSFDVRGELYELTLGMNGYERTVGAPPRRTYFATTRIASLGSVYALTNDAVYSIDPQAGATERVGGLPPGSQPRGITFDPESSRLGLLDGGEILWTSPTAPWLSSAQTDLGGIGVERIAYSAERGIFYAAGVDGLFSIAMNATSAAVIQVSGIAPPDVLTGLTWRDGRLWASTRDGRLHRIDPDTGAWTDVGAMRFGMRGLY